MVKVWYLPGARSLRVLWTLEELGEPYEAVKVLFPPQVRMPEYLAVNPLGTIPAMTDGEVTLTESVAICEYLNETRGGDLAVAPGQPGRPDYLQWLHFAEGSLAPPLGVIMRAAMMPPADTPTEGLTAQYGDVYASRLAAIEARLDGRDYLAGGRFTLADIANAYALGFAERVGQGDKAGPRASAWLDRLRARPAFQRAAAVA